VKLYCGHIECKWTHNSSLELIYFRQKYGDELYTAIKSTGEIITRRYNSRTLPGDIYKHVDFYLTSQDTKATTMFLLKWTDSLDKETIWDRTV
jgi:hypothetical protein